MVYKGIEDFFCKAMLNALSRSEGASLDEHARIIEDVVKMEPRLTADQVAAIADAIPYEGVVPEWHEPETEDGLTLSDIADGMADLSVTVSVQGESIQTTEDGLAELSEIVSGLVPQE